MWLSTAGMFFPWPIVVVVLLVVVYFVCALKVSINESKEQKDRVQKCLKEISEQKKLLEYYAALPESLVKNNPLLNSLVYQHMSALTRQTDRDRLLRALQNFTEYSTDYFDVVGTITHKSDAHRSYRVSFDQCSCPDFRTHHRPCKHMYMLALDFGLLKSIDISKISLELTNTLKSLEDTKVQLNRSRKLLSSKTQQFTWLSDLLADFERAYGEATAEILEYKKHYAPRAADELRRISREKAELISLYQSEEYQLKFYEGCFPWLVDFKVLDVSAATLVVEEIQRKNLIHYKEIQSTIDRYTPRKRRS